MDSSVIISYSHVDQAWMQAVRKHLEGMLRGRGRVWTDEDIPPGTTWEKSLLDSLCRACAAVVLASPDYLVSDWCRSELKSLHDALDDNRLGAVYWLLLRPCGWQWCELKKLQAMQEPAGSALTDLPEGPLREAALLKACERIAAGVTRSATPEDPALAALRNLLRSHSETAEIALGSRFSIGDFSVVYEGREKNEEVVVKVLTGTPLRALRQLFFDFGTTCKEIDHSSVLRIRKVVSIGEDFEKRVVIVTERTHWNSLDAFMEGGKDDAEADKTHDRKRPLVPEEVGTVLLRLAEVIAELHKLGEKLSDTEWNKRNGGRPFRPLMGPLVPDHIYYDPATRRPRVSLPSITNFIWQFFDADTFSGLAEAAGAYRLPEKQRCEPVDERADQYFLGMLGLELLEGRRLFVQGGSEPPAHDYVKKKQPRWAKWHERLCEVLDTLLAEEAGKRYPTMKDVVTELHTLEDSPRALAKYAYLNYVVTQSDPNGIEFSRRFYKKFFESAGGVDKIFEQARKERKSSTETLPDDDQHRKMIEAIKTVLNFHAGARPSSLEWLVARHEHRGIEPRHFEHFKDSFLQTLSESIDDPGDDKDDIRQAWEDLFDRANKEMTERMFASRTTKTHAAGTSDATASDGPACATDCYHREPSFHQAGVDAAAPAP